MDATPAASRNYFTYGFDHEPSPLNPFPSNQTIESHPSKQAALMRTIGKLSISLINISHPYCISVFGLLSCIGPIITAPIITAEEFFDWKTTLPTLSLVSLSLFCHYVAYPIIPSLVLTANAIYRAFQYIAKPDPLEQAFYKITHGKENFNRLPKIPFDDVRKIDWETLDHPMSRSETSDGRKILIVKACPQEMVIIKQIFIFAQQKNSRDQGPTISGMPQQVSYLIDDYAEAVFGVFPRVLHREMNCSGDKETDEWKLNKLNLTVYTHRMSTNLANEFYRQNTPEVD